MFLGGAHQSIHLTLECFGATRYRCPSVIAAHYAFVRLRTARAEQYRRTALLLRLWVAAQWRKAHQLAAVTRFGLSPQHAESLNRLAQPLPARPKARARRFGLLPQPSSSHAQHDTAARHDVERCDRLCGDQGLALRQQADAGAELDPLGDGGCD